MGTACYDMHVGQRAAKLVVCTLAIRGDECLELQFCGNSAAVYIMNIVGSTHLWVHESCFSW